MKRIRELEDALLKLEARLIVLAVLATLLMASYNVVYRNVLVPLQNYWAHSGPPVTRQVPAKADSKRVEAKEESGAGDFGGEFGKPKQAAGDDAGDFGGEFSAVGKKDNEPDYEDEEDDGAEGFGGEFNTKKKPDEAKDEEDAGDETWAGPDDAFDNLPDITVKKKKTDEGPQGGPPAEGSFAAWGVDMVNSLKVEWIDMFLRQLVIIVSFLGAGLATRRRKHINIDALSKLLPKPARRWMHVVTNTLAVVVCVILAYAGTQLVELGIQYPSDLLPWAKEWTFQLMFPIGFGLLAIHFAVRVAESFTGFEERKKPAKTASPEPEEEPEPEPEEEEPAEREEEPEREEDEPAEDEEPQKEDDA